MKTKIFPFSIAGNDAEIMQIFSVPVYVFNFSIVSIY